MKKKYSIKEKKIIERSIVLSDFQKQSFSKQLKKYFDGKMSTNENFYLGVTPKILKINGANEDKLVMSQKALIKIISSDSGHHIPIKILNKIPIALEKPLLVIDGSKDNTLAVIINLKDDLGKKILVAIRLDAKEAYMDVTRITTAYGKKGLKSFLLNETHNILDIYNVKKTSCWLVNKGLQLSKFPSTNNLSYKYIICLKDKKINK